LKPLIYLVFLGLTPVCSLAQNAKRDTIITNHLEEIAIVSEANKGSVEFITDLNENRIMAGRKTVVLNLDRMQIDMSANSSRQVFAKVAGVHIWESDASGIQTNISSRGLSPNRSWEINMRQNGYDIASDAFGYPEAYYTPPLEAVDNIEVIRGSASLQYGPQFGGVVNYQMRKAKLQSPLHVQLNSTLGSYGLQDQFASVEAGGKKWGIIAWYQRRAATGWRQNSAFETEAAHVQVLFAPTSKMQITLEGTRSNFEQQQSGGLVDIMLYASPRTSTRSRNWMSNPWNLGAITLKHQLSNTFKYDVKIFGLLAERNSIGFIQTVLVQDVEDSLGYAKRQVDRDFYTNWGAELRATKDYSVWGKSATLAFGARAYNANTKRLQRGTGDRGSNYSTWVDETGFRSRLNFGTSNAAVFAEQLVRLNEKWSVTPGARLEYISNIGGGTVNYGSGWVSSGTKTRTVVLAGISIAYKHSKSLEVYGNASQSFRPVTFSELTPSSTTEVVDANLKDSKGNTADLGFRGKTKFGLIYDISGYFIHYKNRIGTYVLNGANFKTNIGDTKNTGIETMAEMVIVKRAQAKGQLSSFVNYSYNHAVYTLWKDPEIKNNREGKSVENVPRHIVRYGINAKWSNFYLSLMGNFVDAVYTDALNTVAPNATATIGKIPAYRVFDASLSWKPSENISLTAGVNNLSNEVYATRRSTGYPGPGLLPANGRSFFVTLSIHGWAKKS
jgi:Fe(3+) dicitrate transport protein